MPTAAELTINWEKMTAAEIVRLANACNPWNKGAGTIINDWMIGITEAEIYDTDENPGVVPGQIIECNKEKGLLVKTADNKMLKVTIVYTNEGFFSGERLASFGIITGMRFV